MYAEWQGKGLFLDWMPVTEQELWESTGIYPTQIDTALSNSSKYMQEHYALIAGILPFIGDEKERSRMIRSIAEHKHYSKYSLGWQGGTYSLRGLMLNVVADKVAHCRKHGIDIIEKEWNCKELPGILVTDKGSEYASENFEQLTDMGVSIINLLAYRPELKGSVEKFFDLVQSTYKPYLKGKGAIEPDFQERGSHDYRKYRERPKR